jgi:hypothetical protein
MAVETKLPKGNFFDMLYNTPFAPPKASMESLEDRVFTAAEELGEAAEDGLFYAEAGDSSVIELGGLTRPAENGGEYYRFDVTKKEQLSPANKGLSMCTAGACARFITDAETVVIDAKLRGVLYGMSHFCNRGVYGFDMLVGSGTDRKYSGNIMQMFVGVNDALKDTMYLPKGLKEVQVNFPLYGGVESVKFGFPAGSKVAPPTKRAYKPIAFYGSSITQGGCVGRPGNSYCNIVCRALDADCRNLGFSGSAMGEQVVAEYIGSLELSAFVMDYDYNSPSEEHLRETHRPFFETVRKMQPELPIVLMTHVWSFEDRETDFNRVKIVKETYDAAIAAGDKNVYFIDGSNFFRGQMRDLCTVDALHPNDLGQFIMAEEVYKTLAMALKR